MARPPMARSWIQQTILSCLSSARPARAAQLQIFNRYDRCCFNGIRSQLFKAEVQRTVAQAGHGGRF